MSNKKKYYFTQYIAGGNTYSSFIYADNKKTAKKYVFMRNINEIITGELQQSSVDFNPSPLPSVFYKDRDLLSCIHTIIFYCWIAGKSGIITNINDELLRDDGMIHEITHEMQHPDVYGYRQDIFDKMSKLESEIPGLVSYIDIPNAEIINKIITI